MTTPFSSTERRDRRRALWDGRISDRAAASRDRSVGWMLLSLLAGPASIGAYLVLRTQTSSADVVAGPVFVGWLAACLAFAALSWRSAAGETVEQYGLPVHTWRGLRLASPERFDVSMSELGINTADPANRRGLGAPLGQASRVAEPRAHQAWRRPPEQSVANAKVKRPR